MKHLRLPILLASIIVLGTATHAHDRRAPLDNDQKVFLAQYELTRAALANDDLRAAKEAAAVVAVLTVIHHEDSGDAPPGFVQDARRFVDTISLDQAREVFKSYSKRAIHVTEGKAGYYVVHCAAQPNDERDWVQSTPTVSDPYSGAKMPICGPPKN